MDYRRLTRVAIVAAAVAVPRLGTAQEVRRPSDLITRDEIERAQVEDAYQLVLRLRPEFLHRTERPLGGAGLSSDESSPGSGVLGRARAVGGSTPENRSSDPYSPEFDAGSKGTSAGESNDGPVGFASPTGATSASSGARAAGGRRSPVVVYIGNTLAGGIEELTSLPARSVKEIRYLRSSEAQFRFGQRHGTAAVILVTLEE
jgi:hypothetical protein